MAILWLTVFAGIIAAPSLDQLSAHQRTVATIVVVAVICIASFIQWLVTPYLLKLLKPENGEQLKIVTVDD